MRLKRQDGFALIAALWAMLLVGALAAAYLGEARHVVRVSANRTDLLRARYAALAGLERAENALERLQALSLDGFSRLDVASQARLAGLWNDLEASFGEISRGCLEGGCYDATVRDLGAALNVNLATEAQLRRFFVALGIDLRDADIAAQSIADWIDEDDLHRGRGAEAGYYRALPIPYEPRNGPIRDLSELRRVRGVDEGIFALAAPHLSVEGSGRVNVNSAPGPVLASLPGFGPEVLRVLADARRRGASFAGLPQLALRLSPAARSGLQANMAALVRLTVFEPERIEVMSTGRTLEGGIRVTLRGVYVRAGERMALLRQVRVEP